MPVMQGFPGYDGSRVRHVSPPPCMILSCCVAWLQWFDMADPELIGQDGVTPRAWNAPAGPTSPAFVPAMASPTALLMSPPRSASNGIGSGSGSHGGTVPAYGSRHMRTRDHVEAPRSALAAVKAKTSKMPVAVHVRVVAWPHSQAHVRSKCVWGVVGLACVQQASRFAKGRPSVKYNRHTVRRTQHLGGRGCMSRRFAVR